MNDDATQLRRYIEDGSQQAFTALVEKYIDLVYSAALRRTVGDPHRAADVSQEVFTALARQARTLASHPVLGAWLHSTTRNIAVNLMLSDQRRARRQHTALELDTAQPAAPSPEWEQLRPVLDAAIDELPERDRQPVVMRFLERRPFKEIGAALTISEDAARVRTDRALDKLRGVLAQRGITSTAAALGSAVSAHGTVGAPAGLASTTAVESLAASASGTTTASAFSAPLLVTAVATAVVAFSLGAYVGAQPISAGAATASSPAFARTAALENSSNEETQRLAAEVQRLTKELSTLQAAYAKMVTDRAEAAGRPFSRIIGKPLPRHQIQESILYNLRQLAAAQDQFNLEEGRRPRSIEEIVGETAFVRRIVPVDGEDYTSLKFDGSTFTVTTAGGITVEYTNDTAPYNPATMKTDWPPEVEQARELKIKTEASRQAAVEAFRMSHRGKDPKDEKALLPFFATPQAAADFLEFIEARDAAKNSDGVNEFR